MNTVLLYLQMRPPIDPTSSNKKLHLQQSDLVLMVDMLLLVIAPDASGLVFRFSI